jgi:hypothetical protein
VEASRLTRGDCQPALGGRDRHGGESSFGEESLDLMRVYVQRGSGEVLVARRDSHLPARPEDTKELGCGFGVGHGARENLVGSGICEREHVHRTDEVEDVRGLGRFPQALECVDGPIDDEDVAFGGNSFRELGDRIACSDRDDGIAGPLAQRRKKVKSR